MREHNIGVDVVLLAPPSFKKRNVRVSQYSLPNIGMAYIAAALRDAGFRTSVIDPNAEEITAEECVSRVAVAKPRVIGLSAMTHDIADAFRAAGELKQKLPATPIVLGGVHITSIPLETLDECGDIDFGVFGEGEKTAVELMNFIFSETSGPPRNIDGVCFRESGKPTLNKERTRLVDLDALPFPAWDLFPLDRYKPLYRLALGRRQLPISTSRGCPFNCVFCNNVNGHTIRSRSVETTLNDIDWLIHEHKAGSVVFVDESLTLDMKRAARLFEGMIERGHGKKISWACQTRADRVSPELLSLMKEAGCAYISVGIESGSKEVLAQTGKNLDLETARRSVDWITRSGISADALFLIGLPYDTPETILKTILFARRLNTKRASFANVVPFPGTKIREMSQTGEGGVRALSSDWSQYERHLAHVMELENVSLRKLKFYHFLAYALFFLAPGRIGEFFKNFNVSVVPYYLFHLIFQPREKPSKK